MAEPRIVLFDLETLPNLKEVMRVFPQLSNYPGLTLKAEINSVICFGYKIYASDEPAKCISAWDFDAWRVNVNDDANILEEAYKILKDADAVVTHNGKRFDWKFLQTRFFFHEMNPLHKISHIDTCQIAKSNLMTFNNKLQTISKFLGGESKMENGGWDLWCKVQERDPEACKLMAEYCTQDVEVLYGVYKRLRPLIPNIPNHNLFIPAGHKPVCPSCGSTRLKGHGVRMTKTGIYKRFTCKDCGTYSRVNTAGLLPRTF